jgi:hypothetical protein
MKRYRLLVGVAIAAFLGLVGIAAYRVLSLPAATPAILALQSRAAQGDARAQNDLALTYESGRGVQVDYTQAAKLYRQAADQGLSVAETNMGRIYAVGQVVPRDYAEAMKWFRKAAAQGDGAAMNNIGRVYGEGDGVAQDNIEALKWLYLAAKRYRAEQNEEPSYAIKSRVGLAATMKPSDVAEAQRRAEMTQLADNRPPWIAADDLARLSKLGIDVANDVEEKGNYHWSWRARARFSVSGYSCPAGSEVVISRTIMLVNNAHTEGCRNASGPPVAILKLLPNGSAEPLSD